MNIETFGNKIRDSCDSSRGAVCTKFTRYSYNYRFYFKTTLWDLSRFMYKWIFTRKLCIFTKRSYGNAVWLRTVDAVRGAHA